MCPKRFRDVTRTGNVPPRCAKLCVCQLAEHLLACCSTCPLALIRSAHSPLYLTRYECANRGVYLLGKEEIIARSTSIFGPVRETMRLL